MNILLALRRCLPPSLSLLPVLLSTLALLTSCRREVEYDRRLLQAEQVVEEHPDSALALLGAVDAALLSRPDSALYGLLRAQALYKCYLPVSADTLLPHAIRFFELSGDEHRLTHALFYMGAITIDAHHDFVGAFPFLKRAELITRETGDTLYAAKTAQNLYLIFSEVNQSDYAMCEARKVLLLTERGSHMSTIANMYVGNEYFKQNLTDSALYYYKKAESSVALLNQAEKGMLYADLGMCHQVFGNYDKAEELLRYSLILQPTDAGYLYLARLLNDKKEVSESLALLDLAIQMGHGDNLKYVYLEQAQYYKEQGNISKAIEMMEKTYGQMCINADSIGLSTIVKTDEQMEQEWEVQQSSFRKKRINKMVIMIFLSFCVTSLYVYRKQRNKMHNQHEDIVHLQAKRDFLEKRLSANSVISTQLSHEIDRKQKEISSLQNKIEKNNDTILKMLNEKKTIEKQKEDEARKLLTERISIGKEAFDCVQRKEKIGDQKKRQCFLEYVSIYHPELLKEAKLIHKKPTMKTYSVLSAMKLTESEIATVMSVSLSAVYTTFSRIKKELNQRGEKDI